MRLTPLDIRKQEFKRTLRGYDPEEVDAFMTMIADEFEMLIREKNQFNDELIRLRTQLKDYQQVETTLRDTLVKAQNTVEESRTNSRREAEIVIHEAELQAEHILKEAKEELQDLRNDIHMLKMQKESFAKRLGHLLESQIELLQVLDMDDLELPRDNEVRYRGRSVRPGSQEREESETGSHQEPRIIRDQPLEKSQPRPFKDRDEQDDDDDKGPLSDQVIM
jgi:cell division initiation protein